MNNGWITIGTKLETKDFDKKYEELKRRQEREEIELKIKTESFEKTERKLQELKKEFESFKKEIENVPAEVEGLPFGDDVVDDLVNKQLVDYETRIDKLTSKLEKQRDAIAKQKNEYNDIGKKIEEYAQKIEQQKYEKTMKEIEISQRQIVSSQSEVPKMLEKTSKNLKGIVKNVIRWGMAIFGIQGAYMMVRRAMNTITEQDEQLKADIDYMRNAAAYVLEPVVRKIVELIKQLMFYIGYIIHAWTGKNIFENANKSLQKTNKGVKDLKKQLSGFDEMNVLSSSNGGGSSTTMPSFDLTKLQGEVPGWMQWIVDNGDYLIALITGFATALGLVKLGIDGIIATGIGVIVVGIVYAIEGLLEYLKDPTWENFGQIIQGIGIAVLGVGIAFAGIPAIIVGVIIMIWGTIVKYWDKIHEFIQTKIIDWLSSKSNWIREKFGNIIGDIYNFLVRQMQRTLDFLNTTMNGIKTNFDEVIKFFKNVFTGKWKDAWNNVKNIFGNTWKWIKETFIFIYNSIMDKAKTMGSVVGQAIGNTLKHTVNIFLRQIELLLNSPIRTINSLIGVVNKIPGVKLSTIPTFNLPRLAKGGIVNMPGRGVPVGNALTGENGPEGVIPFSDSQQMQLIGEAIGKYITVNAQLNNYMNGRLISRELQTVQNEERFAYNR